MRRGRTQSCGCLLRERNSFDLIGSKVGMLTVIENVGKNSDGRTEFMCICDCGVRKKYEGRVLKSKKVKSCGGHISEIIKEANTKHGDANSRLYNIHGSMIQRCYNEKSKNYDSYGGRGISICPEWIGTDGYANFKQWSLSFGYSDHLSIDRIDNDGNYEPGNCRWTTQSVQQKNKRNTKYYTYNNKTQTLTDWAEEYGLIYDSLWKRVNKYNYNIEKALTYRIQKIKH